MIHEFRSWDNVSGISIPLRAVALAVIATQLALAWVLAQGEDIVSIPGTKRRMHLEENLGALDSQAQSRRPAPDQRGVPDRRCRRTLSRT